MDRFQLATLAKWAEPGGLNGRKRLQKVVYFLQSAGCPLNAEFLLHHFGPYSRDVANICDEMVGAKLLDEQKESNVAGVQYRYTLPSQTAQLLAEITTRNPERAAPLAPFEGLAKKLLEEDLWLLELGSTIHYFYSASHDWGTAVQGARDFKKISEKNETATAALELAQSVVEFRTTGAI